MTSPQVFAPDAGIASMPAIGSPSTGARARVVRALTLEDAVLFTLVSVVGLAFAALYAFHFGVYQGDALARTYQAAMVLHADRPGFANISFIWTPLPALAQLPLLVDARLAINGFSSQIVSVAFAAASLVVLNWILRSLVQSRLLRYVLLAAYQLNPMVLVYTVNGMTESALIFFVLLAVWALGRFDATYLSCRLCPAASFHLLAVMGGAAALAFLSRYEGLVFGLALGAALATLTLRRGRTSMQRTEGVMVAYATPFLYAIGLWLLANWLIMGNPLYFMNGRGSNTEQAVLALAAKPDLAAAKGDVVRSLEYVSGLLVHVYAAFFAVVGLLFAIVWRLRDRYALGLVLILLSFPLFQLLLHIAGQSFGWARFHIYVIPLTVVGAAYVASRFGRAWPGLLCALVVASSVATLTVIRPHPVWSANEDAYFLAFTNTPAPDQFAPERDMAHALDSVFATDPEARVLFDDLRGAELAVFSGRFERFVGSRHHDFAAALANPEGVVQYVLVSEMPEGSDAVAQASLGGPAPDLELVHETPPELKRRPGEQIAKPSAWRLYRVITPEAPG